MYDAGGKNKEFKENDRVVLFHRDQIRGEGVVYRVGSTCLYCTDDDGNQFHSHTENFRHRVTRHGMSGGIVQVMTITPKGPGHFSFHYEDQDGVKVDPYSPKEFKENDRIVAKHEDLVLFVGVVQKVGEMYLWGVTDNGCRFQTRKDGCSLAGDDQVDPGNFRPVEPRSLIQPNLIGLAGRKGHGKDTAAQALDGYENVKFAGPMKEMTRTFFRYIGMQEETIERCLEGDMKETPLACFGGRSTRYWLQKMGTEFGRDMIWDEIWVSAFADRAKQFTKVANTDMRFPNEVAKVKEMGGKTALIVDPRKPASHDAHTSETAIDTLPVDIVITNAGSIEDLHWKMRSVFAPGGVSETDVEQPQ